MTKPGHAEAGLNNLAALHQAKGNCAEAERLYRSALAIKEKVCGPEHPEVGVTLNNLAVLCKSLGKYDEAGQLYRQALAILEKTLGPDHPDAGACRSNYATMRGAAAPPDRMRMSVSSERQSR